jgi:hypothetical protein
VAGFGSLSALADEPAETTGVPEKPKQKQTINKKDYENID